MPATRGSDSAAALVLRCAVGSRALTVALGLICDALVQDYDTSDHLLPAAPFAGLAHWDSVYYLHLADTLDYTYEHFAAFFPLYPLLVRAVAATLLRPCHRLLPPRAVLALAGALLSNAAFVGAAVLLYHLSARVTGSRRVACAAALLFCISPASVFMSVAYTESLYTVLAFGGMLLWSDARRWPAALLFAAATATRSQGALLGGFFLYDALHAALNRRGPPQSAARRAARALGGAARAALTAAPTLAFQAYVHAQYCAGEGGRAAEWCARGRFAVYGHVQAQYWGIGFLKYYQVKQLPNFLIALPAIGVCSSALYSYAVRHAALVGSGGLTAACPYAGPPALPQGPEGVAARKVVFAWYLAVQLGIAVLVMHVQVITRFLVASPMFYWAAAEVLAPGRAYWPARLLVFYFLAWGMLGSLMFCNFYPWT